MYLVAAELAARGFIVSPTSRSAAGADLLVTDESCNRAFSVQVKTNARQFSYWLLSKKAFDPRVVGRAIQAEIKGIALALLEQAGSGGHALKG